MAYTMLKNKVAPRNYIRGSLEQAALAFIREDCQGLRFDTERAVDIHDEKLDFDGTSLKPNQIPYNMEKDIDRLCLENAVDGFLKSGKKEDAFDVYFCYLEMFVGDYEKTRRMIELLSEFEANGSGLLMKHRDHYSHSVYVFILGLAIYESNAVYREAYQNRYDLKEREAAYHYLRYWGLASLFHDIGYPFELPFEQAVSYFEVDGGKRGDGPFMAYHALDSFIAIDENVKASLREIMGDVDFSDTNELYAHVLANRLGAAYGFKENQMLAYLIEKPTKPDKFEHHMDHAYFSATVLFKKLFGEMNCELNMAYLDSLTAILMHNSLYKFCIAHYKSKGNKPLEVKDHPLAYMLMLCDELQCWDRIAYGRNSKRELHPMGCTFDFTGNGIRAVYLYDEKEITKINGFKDSYKEWLKAYSAMCVDEKGVSSFQKDIERIVDLTKIKLTVETGLATNGHTGNRSYLSDSNFINLYNFAMILNGRWNNAQWKKAKQAGQEEKFLADEKAAQAFSESFKGLSLEYKMYNINQAKAFAGYLDRIGCFYTDKAVDFELVESFSQEDLLKIGMLEHHRWLQQHYEMGWIYGTPAEEERDFLRQHKDMVPGVPEGQFDVSADAAKENYERLDMAEQDKDTDPMECMLAMLKMFDGIRIYRLS